MLQRPAHLQARPITHTFGEEVSLVRQAPGQRVNGRWQPGAESTTPHQMSTAPASSMSERRRRELEEAGLRLEETRLFWTAETVIPTSETNEGDVLLWGGERYRAHSVAPWDGFSEVVAIRVEPQ